MARQRKFVRSYTWGKSLKLEVQDQPHGLKAAVERIHAVIDLQENPLWQMIGSRNTFAKLFDRDDPPDPEKDPIDAMRARLLVEAAGLNASEWDVDDVELPPDFDLDLLSQWAARDSNPEPAGYVLADAA